MTVKHVEALPLEVFEGLTEDATETRILEVDQTPLIAAGGDTVTITFTATHSEDFVIEGMYLVYNMRRPKKARFWKKKR